jgi:hypothetical protein
MSSSSKGFFYALLQLDLVTILWSHVYYRNSLIQACGLMIVLRGCGGDVSFPTLPLQNNNKWQSRLGCV